jgi:hypothetical protein
MSSVKMLRNLSRKLKAEFSPYGFFFAGGAIVLCFFLLWYVLYIMFPDAVPRFW